MRLKLGFARLRKKFKILAKTRVIILRHCKNDKPVLTAIVWFYVTGRNYTAIIAKQLIY